MLRNVRTKVFVATSLPFDLLFRVLPSPAWERLLADSQLHVSSPGDKVTCNWVPEPVADKRGEWFRILAGPGQSKMFHLFTFLQNESQDSGSSLVPYRGIGARLVRSSPRGESGFLQVRHGGVGIRCILAATANDV